MPKHADNSQRPLKFYTMIVFVVVGIVSVLLGQLIPLLSARLSLNDSEAGTFFLAQFSGGLIGTLLSGRVIRQAGFVVTLIFGLVLIIMGLPGLAFMDFWLCWAAIFVYGTGLGVAIPAANLLTVEITEPPSQTRALNFMNFAWGIGAIVCQPFVATTTKGGSIMPMLLSLLGILAFSSLLLFSIRESGPPRLVDDPGTLRGSLWRSWPPWIFAVFSFLCIGIESGLSGWLTTYSNSLSSPLNIAFVFFLSFVAGRALASGISKRFSENSVISFGIALLFTGGLLLAVATSAPIAILGSILIGLGTSPIFPTHMVRFAKAFGPTATRNAIPIFVAGIFGSASISWLVGVVSTEFGGVSKGIVVILVAAAVLIAIQAVILLTRPQTRKFTTFPEVRQHRAAIRPQRPKPL